jgi:hypothetical protein
MSPHRNLFVIIVLIGSEVASVWHGKQQTLRGKILIVGAHSTLLTGEENFPWEVYFNDSCSPYIISDRKVILYTQFHAASKSIIVTYFK